MTNEYENGRQSLEELSNWYKLEINSKNRNEATTRLHLIDQILFKCLGWDKEDCRLEESNKGKYADYTLYAPNNIRVLIVEAKKEGIYFELPSGYSRLEYNLKSLCRDNKRIGKAVTQAMEYCQKRGTQLGVVCNGHQLICFIASRDDGIPPIDGKAIIFDSLNKMIENFQNLWKYLSKPGIIEKNLQQYLLGLNIPNLPSKLSSSVDNYPGYKVRNILQSDLQIVSELVIEDVTKHREIEIDFIKECYCKSGALSRYAIVSKEILKNRYAALFSNLDKAPTLIPISTKKGVTLNKEILAESLSNRPILLLGDIGVGKTIFIRNLMKVEGADLFKNSISLYIDLGSKGAFSLDIRTFILQEIERQLLEEYDIDIKEKKFVHGIYNIELKRFSKGIYSDLKKINPSDFKDKEIKFLEKKIQNHEEHLKCSLNHISKGRKKQIIFILDNADQRNEEVQQKAFIIAQEVAAHWPVTVFLSIRPDTFYRSKKVGALSGYHPKAFTISPPRVDRVIEKRLRFALKLAKGDIRLKGLDSNIFVKLEKLKTYLNLLLYSFDKNKELIEFIDNICIGNIRLALQFITIFIGSGHVDTEKILNIEERKKIQDRHYVVPLHEFVRAIIYGDNIYYNPKTSPIANLFDILNPDAREHFILPILIDYIGRSNQLPNSEGFIEIKSIYDYMQDIGFLPNQINSTLQIALNKQLIESEKRLINSNGELPNLFRVTTLGLYHINILLRNFTYIDAIIIDTPILNDSIKKKISNVVSINERLTRSELFSSYLDLQWEKLELEKKPLSFNWLDASKDLRNDISYVRAKANRPFFK